MAHLKSTILDSLDSIPPDILDEITADGHTFGNSGWYRLLDALDLPKLVGGQIELRWVVTTADELPIAVTPLLRARGEGIYFVYSLRKFFFEHWIEEAVRMTPAKQADFARLFSVVSGYRRFLEWTGSSLDECLIVASPLSYRSRVAVSPSSPVSRTAVLRSVVARLQQLARQRNLPLWFLAVEEEKDARFAEALTSAGCAKSFLFYDNCIPLGEFATFNDYLGTFRRTTRRAMIRDGKRTLEAGIEFEFTGEIAPLADTFTDLYNQTYSKYGESFFHQPPEFWRALQRHLGTGVEAIIAKREGKVLGFSILLKNERRGEIWTYRIGRTLDPQVAGIPYYFPLSFYGPIQRAIELGYRRIWLGPASYETKSVRGARQVPLHNYFWFPRRWDRWFLSPFLMVFGKVSQEQIEKSLRRSTRVEVATPAGESTSPADT